MKTQRVQAWSFFFFLAACCSLSAGAQGQSKAQPNLEESCRKFVQGFYDWYVPKAAAPDDKNAGPSSDLALKQWRASFSAELYRLLREDSEAQAKADEIVGLDWDPFLNTQDPGDPPGDPYVVGSVKRKGESYWVEVYRRSSGKLSEKPLVIPELVFKNGRWIFVNFHGESGDLLSALKYLRKTRQEPAK
jgi:hypothetical protein